MPDTFTVTVSADTRDFFRERTIHGQGGFQSLSRLLAERLKAGRTLSLTYPEVQRIITYARSYGEGGFQARLRSLVVEFTAQNLHRLVEGR